MNCSIMRLPTPEVFHLLAESRDGIVHRFVVILLESLQAKMSYSGNGLGVLLSFKMLPNDRWHHSGMPCAIGALKAPQTILS